MRVDVVTDERGRRLAVKVAEGPLDAARLRREADLLDAATHPGLVELVELVDGPQAVLSTTYLEGGSLVSDRPLDVEEVAGSVAAVASTVADLHGMGLVHGAVAPEHVLLDGDGRPVLCSLGYGGLGGERRPAPPDVPAAFVDPGRAADEPLDPTLDVYAIGAILTSLLSRANGRARGAPADALRRLAERATSPIASDRPTARQLADDVHDHVPTARLPGSPPASVGTPRPNPQRPLETWRKAQLRPPAVAAPRRRLRTLGGIGLVGLIGLAGVVGAVALRGGPSAPEPAAAPALSDPGPASTTTESVVTTTAAAPLPSVTTTPPRPGCPHVPGPISADVDGDGCADAVRFSGGVVEAAGLRWQVGEADDVIAVGDWSCSGGRSLAVLRPGTGEVYAFTGWASADRELEAPLVARVAGGRALRAADLDADGCNELVVERAEGAPAVLRAGRNGR